jgi:hypothetical protein
LGRGRLFTPEVGRRLTGCGRLSVIAMFSEILEGGKKEGGGADFPGAGDYGRETETAEGKFLHHRVAEFAENL